MPLGLVAVFLGFYCHSRFYTCRHSTMIITFLVAGGKVTTLKSYIKTPEREKLSRYFTKKVPIQRKIPHSLFSIYVNMISVVLFDLALSSFPQCCSPLSVNYLQCLPSLHLVSLLLCEVQELRHREMGQCAGMQQFIKSWQRNGARRRAECHVLVQTAPRSRINVVCMLNFACLYVLKLFTPKIMTPATMTN